MLNSRESMGSGAMYLQQTQLRVLHDPAHRLPLAMQVTSDGAKAAMTSEGWTAHLQSLVQPGGLSEDEFAEVVDIFDKDDIKWYLERITGLAPNYAASTVKARLQRKKKSAPPPPPPAGQAGALAAELAQLRLNQEQHKEQQQEEVSRLRARLNNFDMERKLASQTVQREKEIGERYSEKVIVTDSPEHFRFKTLNNEERKKASSVCKEVLGTKKVDGKIIVRTLREKAQEMAGKNNEGKDNNIREDPDMQDPVMSLMRGLAEAFNSDNHPVDTHKTGLLPTNVQHITQMDVSFLLKTRLPSLYYLVYFLELKREERQFNECLGQIINRLYDIFSVLHSRAELYALIVTLAGVHVLKIYCKELGSYDIYRMPFKALEMVEQHTATICSNQCLSDGLEMLCRILLTDPDTLGYKQAEVPVKWDLGKGNYMDSFQLLRQSDSRDPRKYTTDVFKAILHRSARTSSVVVKYATQEELEILNKLAELKPVHVITADNSVNLAHHKKHMRQETYHAVMLTRFCDPLRQHPRVTVVAQAAADIAWALNWLIVNEILHRDVSDNNIGVFELKGCWRGGIFDFSSAKIGKTTDRCSETGAPEELTGTPTCVAASLLKEHVDLFHTLSSHLESLYYALRRAICGRIPGERILWQHRDRATWRRSRFGSMLEEQTWLIDDQLMINFLQDLHLLFWPCKEEADAQGPHMWYGYRDNVTLQEFLEVCLKHNGQLLPPVVSSSED